MMRRNPPARGRRQISARTWRIAGVLTLIGAEALLYGYSYPFFSLALEKRDLAGWLIGLNASLASTGILFLGPLLPTLIDRHGVKHVVATMFAVSFLSFGVLLLVDHLVMWFVARFVMGTCFAALWTSTEIWLNGVVEDRYRGRIIGASGTLYATCQFLGPLVLGEVGVTGSLPLVVAMVPLAVGVAVALSIRSAERTTEDDETTPGKTTSLKLALAVAGGLVAAAFLCGIGETAMQSLLPLYGLAHGLDDAGAARLVAVFSLGEAVMVAGLGWMADRYGRRLTLRLCVAVAAISTALIPFAVDSVALLWPVLFFSGGTVAGVYTLGIVLIGQDFRRQTLAVVSTGFAMAYASGSILGSAPVGYLIDLFGPEALPVSVAIGFLGLTGYLLLYDSDEGSSRIEAAPRPVPNLTYLEDSQFDEDDGAPEPLAAGAVTGPGKAVFPDTIAGWPAPTGEPAHPARAANDFRLAEDDLDERFKRRSLEIAEIVARRQHSRSRQAKPVPEPPRQPASPFAPPPPADEPE